MKKYLLTVFLVLMLVMTACGNNDDVSEQENNNTVDANTEENIDSDNNDGETVEVDKNLLSVEITLPASFFELGEEEEELDFDEITQEAKEQGIKDVTQNNDGSITYKMSKSTHKELMKEIKEEMLASFDEIAEDDDFSSIKEISANKNFDEIDIIVDQEEFENSFDGLAVIGLAFSTMYYQLFDGANPDDYGVIFNYVDEASGETFSSATYPDDFDE